MGHAGGFDRPDGDAAGPPRAWAPTEAMSAYMRKHQSAATTGDRRPVFNTICFSAVGNSPANRSSSAAPGGARRRPSKAAAGSKVDIPSTSGARLYAGKLPQSGNTCVEPPTSLPFAGFMSSQRGRDSAKPSAQTHSPGVVSGSSQRGDRTAAAQTAKQSDVWFQVPLGNGGGKQLLHPLYHQFLLNGKLALENCGFSSPHDGFSNSHRPKNDIGHLSRTVASVEKEATCGGQSDALLGSTASNGPNSRICNSKETMATQVQKQAARTSDDTLISTVEYTANGRISYPYESETNPTGIGFKSVPLAPPTPNKCSSVVILPSSTMTPVAREPQLSPLSSLSAKKSKELLDQSPSEERKPDKVVGLATGMEPFQMYSSQGHSVPPNGTSSSHWVFPQLEKQENGKHGGHAIDFAIPISDSLAPVTPGKSSHGSCTPHNEVIDIVDSSDDEENEMERVDCVDLPAKGESLAIYNHGTAVQESQSSDNLHQSTLEQNQAEDKLEHNGIDLNQTPKPKSSRKKHRPKVVKEGASKKKVKQTTPTSTGTPATKRKYSRRKEAEAIETPSNRNGETSNPTKKRVRRSVTRSLQFDSEATQQEPNIQPVEMLLQHKQGSGYHGNGQQNINCFSQGPETLEELPCGATREFNYLIEKRTGETGKENAQASRITLLRENSRDLGMVRDNDQISSISQSSLPAGLPCTHGSQVINGSQSNYNYMSSDVHSQYWNMIMGNYETRKPCLVKNKDAENLQSYEPLHSYQTSDRRTDEIGGCKQGTNASSFFSAHCFDGEQNNNSLNSQSIYNNLEMNPKGGNKNLIYEASITSPNTGISYAQLSQMPNVCPSRNQRHVPSKVVEPVQTQGMNTQTNLSRVQADKGENSQHGGNNKSTELPVNNSKVLPPSEDVQIVYNNLSLSALHQKAVQESSQAVFQFDGKAPQFGVSSANNVVDLDLLELVIFKLKYLRISDDNLEVSTQNQIVPYNGLGTIVPFHGVADISKKRKPRAKVDLDSETNRVWLLLMGKESDPGADEKNANKEKWWEEERRVFQGRAESFIARMHLVQGDRRFSRWKGSVVDSVVGVFLTQNVSDHLSSSAFMSMAARFPVRTRKSHLDSAKQMEFINLGDDFSEQKEKMLNQPMATPRFESFTQMQYLEERENWKNGYVEGTSNTGLASYCNEISVCYPQTDKQSSVSAFQMCTPSPFTRNVISAVEGLKTTDAALLSQNSVISFQNSFPSFSQLVDHVDPPADSQCTTSRPSHSFMEILLMAGAGDLEGLSKVAFQENMDSTTRSDASRNVGFETSPSCLDDSFNLNKAYTFEGMNDLQFCHGKNDYSGVPDISSFDSTTQPVSRLLGVENSETVNASHSQQSFVKVTTGTNHIRTPHIAYSSKQNLTEFSDNIQPVFSNNTLSTHNSQRKAYTELLTSMSYNSAQPKFLSLLHQEPMLNNLLHASTCSQNNGKPAIITSQLPNNTSYHSVASKVKSCDTKLQQVSGGGKVMSGNTSNIVTKINVNSSTDAPMNSEKTGVKTRKGKVEKEKTSFDWDSLRRQSINRIAKQERSSDRMDSVDWESVRSADVKEISSIIRERGMNNMLSERIKDFLDRLVREHESIDLEWLRDVPPDQAKDYLLSIRGLGLKSVECVRLLTLHHLAFPVDTNVGRICVRLGWVPLQPLPESLQLHLLEMYPLLETIQKYLWPRLCKLDQKTLYELHYQMITFGKVFCTKSKPNCNACPMRGECKHFASAFASARLPLPGPEDNRLVMAQNSIPSEPSKPVIVPMNIPQLECGPLLEGTVINNCEPIIEEPATPEHDSLESLETEIEDAFYEDPDEIPVIKLNIQQFALNLQTIMQGNMEIQEGDMSKALVALTPEAASIPQPKLKNINRLRTEHQVYELPDSHPLLEGLEQREPDDPCPYLLSIWTPGETAQSTELPDISCTFQENGGLCDKMTCFACNSKREAHSQTVRGTLLVPCRTAMRGSFPLNGTYFQVNEVFADHSSSLSPIEVPRKWIWNLPRRTVYFGTSVPTIFRGLTTEGIQHCFWRGFVCVRGFDRETRAPRPLMARLHFPVSKTLRKKRMAGKENEQIQQN